MTLGEKLKMLRASRGLSQEQLAAELNVSRQAVSKWECGDAAPDLDKLRAICTYFAVTTDYLIWENEEDTPKAAVLEKERAVRGRNEVFSDALLLVLLLAGIVALWNSLRLGFASRAALHIVLAVAAIAAAILSTTIWKQRGRVIALLIAATGAVLALSRLAAMLAYLFQHMIEETKPGRDRCLSGSIQIPVHINIRLLRGTPYDSTTLASKQILGDFIPIIRDIGGRQ